MADVLDRYHELGSRCELTHAEHHFPVVVERLRRRPPLPTRPDPGRTSEGIELAPPLLGILRTAIASAFWFAVGLVIGANWP